MKRYFWIFIALFGLAGCARSEFEHGDRDGLVELSMSVDGSLNIKQSKGQGYNIPLPDDFRYTVRYAANNAVAATGTSTKNIGPLALMAGNYLLEVESTEEPSLDRPHYAGSTKFSVKKGNTTTVEVSAKLASAVVEVCFTDAVKNGFASYRATITADGVGQPAVFDHQTPAGKLVYLPAPAANVNCLIEVKSEQGLPFSTQQRVASMEGADLVSWKVDVPRYEEKPTDPLVVELLLTRTLNEEETKYTVGLNPTSSALPVIWGQGIPNLSLPIGVKYGVGSEVKLGLTTKAGLAKVLLLFPEGQKPLVGQSNQGLLDLMAMSQSERAAWGAVFAAGGTAGATETTLDLGAMTAKMPGDANEAQKFLITVGLLDHNGNYVAYELTFNVYGVSVTTLGYLYANEIDWFGVRGARNLVNVEVRGQYNVEQAPEGLAFLYRRKGASDWLVVEDLVVEPITKSVRAILPLVADGGVWEYRLSSADENAAVVELPAMPIYPFYTNMSLDAWAAGTRVNPDNWGSPNYDGVFGIGVVNSTSRQPGRTGSGHSARIVSGDAAGKFASGGLFTGVMSVDMSNPYKSAKVGKPFAGRPKKLVGYYKYKSVPIHRIDGSLAGLPGNAAKSGAPDVCEIAIKLERWNGGNYSVRWRDGFFGTPENPYKDENGNPADGRSSQVVNFDGNGDGPKDIRRQLSVGYGAFTSTGQEGWARFEIDIEYFQDVMPDHLIITCVSSAYGGYMSGAEGSELWVDDFELVY